MIIAKSTETWSSGVGDLTLFIEKMFRLLD